MAPVYPAIAGAGIILQTYGNYQATKAQARAEQANALFYREQAAFAKEAGERDLDIHKRKSEILTGNQISKLANSGADASEIAWFVGVQANVIYQEGYAIERDTEMNVRLATLRANQAEQTARDLKSGAGLRAAGGLLSGGANIFGAAK